MYRKVENLEIDIQLSQLEVTIKKLLNNTLFNTDIIMDHQLSLWDLCEQLSVENFISLKQNVYFADFLRLFSITIVADDRSHVEVSQLNLESCNLDLTKCKDSESNLQQNRNRENANLNVEDTQIPKMSTRLDDLQLSDKFLKLITRLRNASLSHEGFSLEKLWVIL